MTLTLAAANRRLTRLEARRPGWCGYPRLAPPSVAFLRVVLGMLAESGALEPPSPGVPDRFCDVRHALYGLDDPSVVVRAGPTLPS